MRTAKTPCVQRGGAFSSGDVCRAEVPELARGQPGWTGKGRELSWPGEPTYERTLSTPSASSESRQYGNSALWPPANEK